MRKENKFSTGKHNVNVAAIILQVLQYTKNTFSTVHFLQFCIRVSAVQMTCHFPRPFFFKVLPVRFKNWLE
jgi:hypothetical protein